MSSLATPSFVVAAAVAVALAACQRNPEPASHPPQAVGRAQTSASQAPQPLELTAHHSPIAVELRGPATVTAGRDIDLTAEIERRVGAYAVQLDLQLPPGVRLVAGNAAELLPIGDGTLVRHFTVHLDQVPEREVIALASIRTPSFGAQARGAYRFGKPAPSFAEPAHGAPLTLNGRYIGTPVQLPAD